MALESEAAFQSRALEVGIAQGEVDALKVGGINSYSRYAFCCAYQPGSGNEDVLFDYLENILGSKPTGLVLLIIGVFSSRVMPWHRRIFRVVWNAVTIQRSKFFCLAEKVQRIEALKLKYPGAMLSTSMEPSHELIDRAVRQYEENCVRLVELHKCTSREQEIKSERTTSQLSFDASGNIKV